jgi:GT2 family glycosyltransferase
MLQFIQVKQHNKMAESKKLSVLIVNFASASHLENCIASIYRKFGDFLSWEVIIINNDKTQDISKLPLDFSKVRIVNSHKNVGFGSGINIGAKEAGGEFLLTLNPDTEIISENVVSVLDEFSKDDKIGIISGKIISKKGVVEPWSAGKELTFFDLILNNAGFSRSRNIWNSPKKIECDWTTGTALFIKKGLFDKLGGFDENFFMYFEDMDLCKRMRNLGKKVIFFPEFEIYHSSGKSYVDKTLQKKHYYDSMEYYFKKYGHSMTRKFVKLIRKFFIRK